MSIYITIKNFKIKRINRIFDIRYRNSVLGMKMLRIFGLAYKKCLRIILEKQLFFLMVTAMFCPEFILGIILLRLPKLKKILKKQIQHRIIGDSFDYAISCDTYHITVVVRCCYIIEFGLCSNSVCYDITDTLIFPQHVRFLMLPSTTIYVLLKATDDFFLQPVLSLVCGVIVQANSLRYVAATLSILIQICSISFH